MAPLSDEDFVRLHTYIQTNYGIDLRKKKQLIVSRLQNYLPGIGYQSFNAYVNDIVSGRHADLVTPMLNKLTTNYTYFMREKEHFDFLQNTILPQLKETHRNDRSIAIWSAGCSSGEEPYNISMYLLEYFSGLGQNWDTRILATDLSADVLGKAMNPSWPPEALEVLPKTWQQKYFVKLADGNYTVSEQLRKNVIFRPFNLMDPIRFKRKFDLIFCRNVMIYFDQPTKDALVQRFYDATEPNGYLYIGHSEGLNKLNCPYDYLLPAIYKKGK